ncbi:MAG: hypothetical protein HQM01_02055 [Magnetococcales bacterium]|nr:hypothetical protein [Magnetococcales bacterium]
MSGDRPKSSIRLVYGLTTEQNTDVIVLTCDVHGTLGERNQQFANENKIYPPSSIGFREISVCSLPDNRYIFFAASVNEPAGYTTEDDIIQIVAGVIDIATRLENVNSIAIPFLGLGRGGLRDYLVSFRAIVETALKHNSTFEILVCAYYPKIFDKARDWIIDQGFPAKITVKTPTSLERTKSENNESTQKLIENQDNSKSTTLSEEVASDSQKKVKSVSLVGGMTRLHHDQIPTEEACGPWRSDGI